MPGAMEPTRTLHSPGRHPCLRRATRVARYALPVFTGRVHGYCGSAPVNTGSMHQALNAYYVQLYHDCLTAPTTRSAVAAGPRDASYRAVNVITHCTNACPAVGRAPMPKDLVKAKFRYAIWSQTGSKLVCLRPASDLSAARPDSVMEFGFNRYRGHHLSSSHIVFRVWNCLPQHVTSAPSLSTFRSRLKTHLFSRCYPAVKPEK